jgi:hypothetical protein
MTKRAFAWCFAICVLVAGPALGQSAIPESLPKEAKRLDDDAIRSLMGTGATFHSVGAGGRVTGTSVWNLSTATAYGTFTWDGKIKGTWNLKWSVDNDLSCLESIPGQTVCEQIYGYRDGFFEVDKDGTIHTLTTPLRAAPLAEPLTADEAADMYVPLMKWGQSLDLRVVAALEADGVIHLEIADDDGNASGLRIDAKTGEVLGAN